MATATPAVPSRAGRTATPRCTLGVVVRLGRRPGARRRAAARGAGPGGRARPLRRHFRATANLTTVLDLLGRRQRGGRRRDSPASRRAVGRPGGGLRQYLARQRRGFAVRARALGRVARARARRALDWSPPGVSVRQRHRQPRHRRDRDIGPAKRPAGCSAGSSSSSRRGATSSSRAGLSRRRVVRPVERRPRRRRAGRRARLGPRPLDRGLGADRAKMAASVLEVDAGRSPKRRTGAICRRRHGARALAREVLAEAEKAVARAGVARPIGSRREADALLATARAFRGRLDGRDDPAAWDGVARAWGALGDRYRVARARWRQAEALLAIAARARRARRADAGPCARTLGSRWPRPSDRLELARTAAAPRASRARRPGAASAPVGRR